VYALSEVKTLFEIS